MHGKNTNKQLVIAAPAIKASLLLCSVFLLALPANSQTRRQPDTTKLTCAQTHDLIERYGGINLKSGQFKFDRYVTGRNHCFAGQSVRTTFVPTKDSKKCSVLICAEVGQRNN